MIFLNLQFFLATFPSGNMVRTTNNAYPLTFAPLQPPLIQKSGNSYLYMFAIWFLYQKKILYGFANRKYNRPDIIRFITPQLKAYAPGKKGQNFPRNLDKSDSIP